MSSKAEVASIHLRFSFKKYLDNFKVSIHSSKMKWSVVVRINRSSKVLGSRMVG